jgi:phosphotransferase system enzyme I (PtsI)
MGHAGHGQSPFGCINTACLRRPHSILTIGRRGDASWAKIDSILFEERSPERNAVGETAKAKGRGKEDLGLGRIAPLMSGGTTNNEGEAPQAGVDHDVKAPAAAPQGTGAVDAGQPDSGRGDLGNEADRRDANPKAEVAGALEATGGAPIAGEVLRGTSVSPGLVLGRAHRKDHDLSVIEEERVAIENVDGELNRFRAALELSKRQISDLKSRLTGQVAPNDSRILDTHLAYLKDSVFIADVEQLILVEQLRLDAAIAKVIGDFDRIFRLVESETLRQSAVDLRDVGIRVLRNIDGAEPVGELTERYILVARELSIVDMFDLNNEHVLGIVTEGGGLTSHAAIFARSMRIPTLTGVDGLLDKVVEGDYLILDSAEGQVRINPGELARAQYTRTEASTSRDDEQAPAEPQKPQVEFPILTTDGVAAEVSSIAGNLAEVDRSADVGLPGLGLYRTELLYLLDKEQPSRTALVTHYRAVAEKALPGPIMLRLLSANSGLGLRYLYAEREANPHLGRVGIRILLQQEAVLRRQLQAMLLAFHDRELEIALPFVTDCGELRRVKELLFEERTELRKQPEPFQEQPRIGVVIQTPASVFGMSDLAREADFLTINLDSLLQGLLAADRDTGDLAEYFESMHPYVLRMLKGVVREAAGASKPLSIFGVSAADTSNLPLLFGIGLRRFLVPARKAVRFADEIRSLDSAAAARAARVAAASSCLGEAQSVLGNYRHGYARPGQ